MAALVQPIRVLSQLSPVQALVTRLRSGRFLLALTLGMTTSCGMTGSGLFGQSRGEAYADCASLWEPERDLKIYTWWKTDLNAENCETGGEACAVRSLEETYALCTGGTVELVNRGSKEGTLADLEAERNEAESERNAIEPTADHRADGAIINGKADVCRLVGDDLTKSGLANLGTAEAPLFPFLNERTPEPLRDLVTCHGYQFGAIVGVHRLNQLYYKASITDMPAIADALAAKGIRLKHSRELPLQALSDIFQTLVDHDYDRPLLIIDDPTMWSRFLIENLMIAKAEANAQSSNNPVDSYTDFWGELSKDDHEVGTQINMVPFNSTLNEVEKLAGYIRYVSSKSEGQTILQDLIAQDQAVFTVTGDWEEANMPGTIDVRPFPGTDRAYVYTADVAVAMRPSTTLSEESAIASWLKVVTSRQAQKPFAELKHSLSFLTTINGYSQKKNTSDLFTVDGVGLRGYQGLPAYIPHLFFDELGGKIQKHMKCLVDTSAIEGSTASDCLPTKTSLSKYVQQQYCNVVTGSADGCNVNQGPLQPSL